MAKVTKTGTRAELVNVVNDLYEKRNARVAKMNKLNDRLMGLMAKYDKMKEENGEIQKEIDSYNKFLDAMEFEGATEFMVRDGEFLIVKTLVAKAETETQEAQ
jgi:uncharacterized coiled-coil DUF342 family protein